MFDYDRENPCSGVLELLIASGVPVDLLLGLRVGDIDAERLRLSFPGQKRLSEARFPREILPLLLKFTDAKGSEEFVFSAQKPARRPLALRTVQKFLARAAEDLRLPKISVQSIRDNFAVYSLMLGGDPGLLMNQMGYRHRRSFRRILSAVPPEQRKFPSPIDRLRSL